MTADRAINSTAPDWVPAGDDSEVTSALLSQVLERQFAFTDELRVIANRHVDQAPASCLHVTELTAILARAVLDWIQDWPT
ncbi:hypothetical protein ACXPWS_05025 [Mycobacterium sp. BMJ-28]